MFTRFVLFAVLSLSFCFSEEPKSLVNLEAEPSSVIHGCVNAITGDYVEFNTDLVVPGIEPLIIQRNYQSSKNGGNFGYGWSTNHSCRLDMELSDYPSTPERERDTPDRRERPTRDRAMRYADNREYILEFHDEMGSITPFKGTKSGFKINDEAFKKGVTNCAAGEISARTNHKNTRLITHNR